MLRSVVLEQTETRTDCRAVESEAADAVKIGTATRSRGIHDEVAMSMEPDAAACIGILIAVGSSAGAGKRVESPGRGGSWIVLGGVIGCDTLIDGLEDKLVLVCDRDATT
jgi:hypothetical protein